MTTGEKIILKPNGKGSYLMVVKFADGGGETEITVDSGAEENVCPYEWGKQFGIEKDVKHMNFFNASGGRIKHLGKREVQVVSLF